MKTLTIFCFLFLVSTCIFAVRAEEDNQLVDALKNDNQPEEAVISDEETMQESDDEAEEDYENTDDEDEETSDEENTDEENMDEENDDDESNDEEETEDDEDEDQELESEDEEKRGRIVRKCRSYRKGYLFCTACGCQRRCRRKCTRRVCRRRRPLVCKKRRFCRIVKKPKLLERPIKKRVGYRFVVKYVTYTKYYPVRVCNWVPRLCPWKKVCRRVRKPCLRRRCPIKCRIRRCTRRPLYPHIKG